MELILSVIAISMSFAGLLFLTVFYTSVKVAMAHTEIANQALKMAIETSVRLGAVEKSTHTVIPVSAETDLEKKLQEITGIGREDFNTDLERAGFESNLTPDDLV